MQTFLYPEKDQWPQLLDRPYTSQQQLLDRVKPIVEAVRVNGNQAIKSFTRQFDKIEIDELLVSQEEIDVACIAVDNELKGAINRAMENIRIFHESQQHVVKKVETEPGVTCWQKSVAIQKTGLYIPGGSAPLFSTILMLAVPARIAGCPEIYLCTPPGADGKINPVILYTAHLTGVTAIYKVGGAQAIAAMAYGTETIPRVDKIFGPGNSYVTAAKQLVALDGVAIDLPAGPSEVEVMADESANPAFVASDLLSQAEHGADSQVILITNSEQLATKVLEETEKQTKLLPRAETVRKALENSRIIVLRSMEEMIEITNMYAPEHLILEIRDDESAAEKIINAGSVFLGHYTPESAGDYASGTNHTLPTYGYAKAYSGVNLDSFTKKITFQKITPNGLQHLGPVIETMAAAEQLNAHKNAVSIRLEALKKL